MAAKWFYRRAGAEHGPVSSGKIRRMVARGELEPTDMLWKVGMDEWRPAGDSAKLFGGEGTHSENRRRRSPRAPRQRRREDVDPVATPAVPEWVGKRPLLTSIGIGAGAGVLISAVLAALIVAFSPSLSDDIDAAVGVVAPPAKPQPAKPEPPKPRPAPPQPELPQPAAAEAVAVAAPPATQPPADPPAVQPPADPPESAPAADIQAEAQPKPLARIRVRLPGDDF